MVCFVLLSIILGVTTYMGYNESNDKTAKVTEATQKETTAKKDRDWWKYRALEIQALSAGVPLKDGAGETDASAPPSGGSGQTEFVTLLQTVGKTLTNEKGKVDTYDERVKLLTQQLTATRDQLAASEANLKKANDRYVSRSK